MEDGNRERRGACVHVRVSVPIRTRCTGSGQVAKSSSQSIVGQHDDTKISQQTLCVFHYVNFSLYFPHSCLFLVFFPHSSQEGYEREVQGREVRTEEPRLPNEKSLVPLQQS